MKVLFISFIVGFVGMTSCKKNSVSPIPNIPTDLTININLPSYNSLTGVGGWTYVVGGSKGIVVYRKSIDEFVAFDRHSPANGGVCQYPLVSNEDNFLQLDDTCSGATFSLYDGSPLSGSELGLLQYYTYFDGQDNLRIYN